MTRKDYELIARAVYRARPDGEARRTVHVDYEYMLDALQQDNARFNRAKFAIACGMKPEMADDLL